MANYKLMIPWIKKWEGGYANDPDDAGGCTMKGITIATYQRYFGKDKTCSDLKNITDDEWTYIFINGFWDKFKADQIENQSIAQLCVQMGWGSGTITAIKRIQRCLGCAADGIVGPITLSKINQKPARDVFEKLWQMRRLWLIEISKKGNNKKYLKGWLNRLDDLKLTE